MFSILKNQVNITDIVNKSSASFITKVAKKNSVTAKVVVVQDRIITWHAKKAQINYST